MLYCKIVIRLDDILFPVTFLVHEKPVTVRNYKCIYVSSHILIFALSMYKGSIVYLELLQSLFYTHEYVCTMLMWTLDKNNKFTNNSK